MTDKELVQDPFEILMLTLDDLFFEFGAQDNKGIADTWFAETFNPITRGYTMGSFRPEVQEKIQIAYEAWVDLVEMEQESEEDYDDEEE
jgi:hypothetical protein